MHIGLLSQKCGYLFDATRMRFSRWRTGFSTSFPGSGVGGFDP